MPRLSIQVPHTLGREEATRRIKEQIPKVRDHVADLDERWQDHTLAFNFKLMGFEIGGTLVVEDTAANLDVELPPLAMMIKGKIERRVREELGAVFA